MIINRLIVKNWRNFQQIDVGLSPRQFIVGANASGKSNLLDIFRFLRDIVKAEGGGFQKAVKDRGGVSKIRCLAARQRPRNRNRSSPRGQFKTSDDLAICTRVSSRTLGASPNPAHS